MKWRIILLVIITAYMSSCVPNVYYQLYKTESKDVEIKDYGLVYENEDVRITYDFWSQYGDSGFFVYNKTDQDILVQLDRSHLIINGIANTYYKNRSFSESSSTSIGVYKSGAVVLPGSSYVASRDALTARRDYAVSYLEERVVRIPNNSAKYFAGLNLNSTIFRNCDLALYPTARNIKSLKYNENNTPLLIRNIVSYITEHNYLAELPSESIETVFWVSEITNYPSASFSEREFPEICGRRSRTSVIKFLYRAPNSFYIRYTMSN